MDYIHHSLLQLAMTQEYPNLVPGVDYLLGNPTTKDGVYTGDAFIAAWKIDGDLSFQPFPPDITKMPDPTDAEQAKIDKWNATVPDVAPLLEKAKALAPKQQSDEARANRDVALSRTDWLVSRHRDELAVPKATTLSAEQFASLLAYRDALRALPESANWPYAKFPEVPEFVK